MKEVLTIKKLGPLKNAKIEPRPLTVIIGPQASGKSLIAQCLYFFRGLETHLARNYASDREKKKGWQARIIQSFLDKLRGVPFAHFAEGSAVLSYRYDRLNEPWQVAIDEESKKVALSTRLREQITTWHYDWEESKTSLIKSIAHHHIFIPTERSIFTRLQGKAPSVLYNLDIQPYPSLQFAEYLEKAKFSFSSYFENTPQIKYGEGPKFIRQCQINALSGEAYVPKADTRTWKWRIDRSNSANLSEPNYKILPVEAASSGQMEGWPFFVVASTYGLNLMVQASFYFEEPETHLHPAAQIEVINSIGFLVGQRGRTFVITTHSPFILYIINNMIMRYLATGEKFKDNKVALNPDDVAVYRIVGGKCEEILDRDDTKLIPETELDDVANQLGSEFDELLGNIQHHKSDEATRG